MSGSWLVPMVLLSSVQYTGCISFGGVGHHDAVEYCWARPAPSQLCGQELGCAEEGGALACSKAGAKSHPGRDGEETEPEVRLQRDGGCWRRTRRSHGVGTTMHWTQCPAPKGLVVMCSTGAGDQKEGAEMSSSKLICYFFLIQESKARS